MDIFCAGMTSTQRSESANHMLKRFIQRSAPMHTFVAKFRDFQFDRNQEEHRQNHLTKQMTRGMRLGMPIEKHSETIYTREMHDRFVKQLFEAGSFTIVDKSDSQQRFTLVHINELGYTDAREYTVYQTNTEKYTCTCGLYEHSGLPCRHILKVLLRLDKVEIPKGNIHPRWRRETTTLDSEVHTVATREQLSSQTDGMKKRLVILKALEVSQIQGPIDDHAFTEAMRAIQTMVPMNKTNQRQASSPTTSSPTMTTFSTSSNLEITCPPRPKKSGRPIDTSLKSWTRHANLEKEKIRQEDAKLHKTGPHSKTRSLSDLMHVT